MLLARGRAAALALALHIALASAADAADAARETDPAKTAPARTIKERLSSKASDEQRVNDCKVPLAARGSRSRPDDCPDDVGTAPGR